ncbi:MAG: hypothetical protein HFJ43_05615 [Clostridia bacterium]|nr:hypothetical protein [Clostridia bacterium]
MEDFKNFLIRFRYQIIGALIAILLLCTGAYKIILWIFVIIAGIYAGYYFGKNKEDIKEKLKNLIDKM